MSDPTASPFKSRGFKIAAVVIGLLIVSALVIAVASFFNGGDAPDPTSAPISPSEVAPEDASACGLEGFESVSSLTAAPGNDWELVGTAAAPTDRDGAGPGVIDADGFRSCYAHTAEGALFAASNFVALGTDATLRARLTELVAPGPGRDVVEAQQGQGTGSTLRAQIAGFNVGAYSETSATVDLAVSYSSGDLVSIPIKLEWIEGDWKLVLSDDGSMPLQPAALSSLGGFIPWAGA